MHVSVINAQYRIKNSNAWKVIQGHCSHTWTVLSLITLESICSRPNFKSLEQNLKGPQPAWALPTQRSDPWRIGIAPTPQRINCIKNVNEINHASE